MTAPLLRHALRQLRHGRAAQYARAQRGNVLTWAALLMVPLLGFMGLGVDTARGYMVRARLSQALDSAALAAGRSNADQLAAEQKGKTIFTANFPSGYMDATLSGPTFVFNNTDHTVKVAATATIPTYFVHMVGPSTFTVSADTEVKRNANSLEIALVLDITGSMSGSKIKDLKAAAKDMIDVVVWDDQSEYYSKVAIIPYSNSVNVGAYASQVRTVLKPAITGATKANPVVITSANHGLQNGDKILVSGIKGMTQINTNSNNSATKTTNPAYWIVANKTTNTFQLTRSNGSSANGRNWNSYTSAGTIDCFTHGCQYYTFTNAQNGTKTFEISTCASERTGAEAYTDAAPSAAKVGRVYPPSDGDNPCPASTIMPLSPDKAALKSKIDAMSTDGSTAGHIGIAWGWYMISPNFGYLWPSASAPAAYGTDELIKIAVIMTDGEFNTAYCNGVIAKNSGSGSGDAADHSNCNATNGSSASQALEQCAAMKAKGIVVFTVGFDLDSQATKDLMVQCATSASYAYIASDGAALKEAFRSIAINISRLRISK
jgi:Flp pilus assembly protein TadG